LQAPVEPPYKGTLDVLQRTLKSEGFFALYRGFGAILVGGTPGTIMYLCSYDYVKNQMSLRFSEIPDFAVHFTAGMLAETFACIIYVPVDVVKERLQVQRGNEGGMMYHGSYDALKKIIKYEGIGGFYKGYFATLASFGPFSALYFVFYERLKELSRKLVSSGNTSDNAAKHGQTNVDIPFHHTILGSATAGAAASWLTSPLDMAKLRLQIQRGGMATNVSSSSGSRCGGALYYTGMMDCLRKVYTQQGVHGLFRGAGARVIHYVPAMTVTMTCYEEFRRFYSNLLRSSKQ